MEIDWIHRPRDSGADGADPGTDPGGTLNLCFNALDRHVVRGLADEVALRVDRFTESRSRPTSSLRRRPDA